MSAYHLYRKSGNSGKNSNGRSIRWKVSRKKVIPLEVFFLFPIFTETTVPFVRITSARLHFEKAKKITGFCK